MTEDLIKDGINKSLENANSLFEEANILQDNNKLERSYSLYQFCIEETGKALSLFELLLTENYKENKKINIFLKNFKNHKFKIKESIGIDTLTARIIEDKKVRLEFLKGVFEQFENISKINDLKNHSLYTSYIDGQFVLPKEIINETLLSNIRFFADTRLSICKQLLPKFYENLDSLRPLFQKEIDSMTTEKQEEMIIKLFTE